jgi:hypothetical protein
LSLWANAHDKYCSADFQYSGKCWLPLPEEFPHVGAIPLSPLGFHD